MKKQEFLTIKMMKISLNNLLLNVDRGICTPRQYFIHNFGVEKFEWKD